MKERACVCAGRVGIYRVSQTRGARVLVVIVAAAAAAAALLLLLLLPLFLLLSLQPQLLLPLRS